MSGLESIHNRHAYAQNGRGSGLVVPVPSCSSDAPGSRTVPAVNDDATAAGTVNLAGLTPAALQQMTSEELSSLATDIRRYLVDTVSRTGGHLGPNLGVVELTLALHRVFDSPRIPIIFDVGHQCYVHKLVTGRGGDLARLRTAGGPSGYPNRAESVHDLVENSHASTALGYADGLSRAFELAGQQRPVVVVVGDGALTGGPAWEALNNLSTARRPVVIVLNDNGDSYAPTVGGLSDHLRRLAARGGLQDLVEQLGGASVPVEPAQFDTWFGMLGLDYAGPVDGHDLAALESAFRQVADTKAPIVVHCLTRKGRGHPPAEADQIDHMLGGPGSSVRVGDIAASTAAQQSSSVGVATVDANGTLGRNTTLLPAFSSLQSDFATLQDNSELLFDLSDQNRRDIRDVREGVAMALALDTPAIPSGATMAVSGGIGYYDNKAAVASTAMAMRAPAAWRRCPRPRSRFPSRPHRWPARRTPRTNNAAGIATAMAP